MVLESTGIRKGCFNVINFLLNKRKFFLYTFHGLHFLNGDNLLTSHLTATVTLRLYRTTYTIFT